MARTPKAGYAASNRAPLGGFALKLMQAIKELGDKAYGAEIEAWLNKATGQETNQGQVYVTAKRLVEKKYLATEMVANAKRGGDYQVKIYRLTKAGDKAIADSIVTYDALRLFATGKARKD